MEYSVMETMEKKAALAVMPDRLVRPPLLGRNERVGRHTASINRKSMGLPHYTWDTASLTPWTPASNKSP